MENNYQHLRDSYEEKGYFIIRNGIDTNILDKAFKEIISSKKIITYKDRLQSLRRIEQINDKGPNLLSVNKLILKYLSEIFLEDFYFFKDKYNAKPPKGEGFFAHYDGIFYWPDEKRVTRDGWYFYAKTFVNVLACIDPMTPENGPLEVSAAHKGNFKDLLKNTKNDGTPDLRQSVEDNCSFEKIICDSGDLLFFSNCCPHRSSKNRSKNDRRTIYYTYNPQREGNYYSQYFVNKSKSRNPTIKSLSGEI